MILSIVSFIVGFAASFGACSYLNYRELKREGRIHHRKGRAA